MEEDVADVGWIDNGIPIDFGPRLRTTGATGYELGDGARGGTFVLANVQNNEIFCLGVSVSVSVDGDEGDDGYSPLGDFEPEGGDDNYYEGQQTGKTED